MQCLYRALLDLVEITNTMHKFAQLLYVLVLLRHSICFTLHNVLYTLILTYYIF
jgi:hypothetical protein